MDTGLYTTLSDAEYFAAEGLNFSTFRAFLKSGKAFLYQLENPVKTTPAMTLGSLFHAMVLAPETICKYKRAPKYDARTKEGKKIRDDFQASLEEDDVLVTEEMWETAIGMVEGLEDTVKEELKLSTLKEVSLFFSYSSLSLKAKLDSWSPDRGVLLDVKTISNISDFERVIINRYYYLQLAWYDLALRTVTDADVKEWKIAFIETEPPYDSLVCSLDNEYKNFSRYKLMEHLEYFIGCQEIYGFTGVSVGRELTVRMPSWLEKKEK